MTKETAELISRLNASRDALKGLNIGDYALIRGARDVMADASNALDSVRELKARAEAAEAEVARLKGEVEEANKAEQTAKREAGLLAGKRMVETVSNAALQAENKRLVEGQREELKSAYVAGCVDMAKHAGVDADDFDEAGYDYADSIARTLLAATSIKGESDRG